MRFFSVAHFTKKASACGMSPCSTTPAKVHCPSRTIIGKGANQFDEILREKCTTNKMDGYTSLCCPKGSMEGQLASVSGAEPYEFPHIAKLKPMDCGGTIYNKRVIITAAHCVVDEKTNELDPASDMKVIIGSNAAGNEDDRYVYKVVNVTAHEKYSKLKPNSETMGDKILWDIALMYLDKDIEFGPNVKALRISEPDFDPRLYADQAIIAGWGTTDTLELSAHLQKTNLILRDPENCFGVYKRENRYAVHSQFKEFKDQLLCVGGVLEGKWSPISGQGDSGGPAICRGPNGQAVLCGVTSFGVGAKACLENNDDETSCAPSIYARVSYFNDWIKKKAGEGAEEKDIFKPFVYGEPVKKGMYEHQVHITSDTGKSCGGTLVSEDVVITAASCVSGQAGVKVHYGLNDLKGENAAETYEVKNVTIIEGFQRVGGKVDVEKQGHHIRITDEFYKNDLAVIKIEGTAPINKKLLPKLPNKKSIFVEGKEIAFPRSTDHGGKLSLRDFHILDKEECQKRMTRVAKGEDTMGGGSMKIGGDILCGVEKYSGGSLCDRELGGGLICKNEKNEDVLCGVQIFRLCEWSIPNGFLDISQKSDWIMEQL